MNTTPVIHSCTECGQNYQCNGSCCIGMKSEFPKMISDSKGLMICNCGHIGNAGFMTTDNTASKWSISTK